MNSLIYPVILCGGNGTRLWPRSRAAKPKPFLPLVGDLTLFEEALHRCSDQTLFAPPVIVTGIDHQPHVEAQARHIEGVRVVVEPQGRNTAPAIALAAAMLPDDAVMLVCPSDHHIADRTSFSEAAAAAAALAARDYMVAFGIAATSPETGYGYIRAGEALGESEGFWVEKFIEKPDLPTAEAFLAEGNYSWNGGIFAFRAGALLAELEQHRPDMARMVRQSVEQGEEDGALFHPGAAAFGSIQAESIDYAVMENTSAAAMVPVDMGWSDIGNWSALHGARERDGLGNSMLGDCELVDCENVAVETDGPRVSGIGLRDVIIVVDGDEVLVTSADGAQLVGKLDGAKNQ